MHRSILSTAAPALAAAASFALISFAAPSPAVAGPPCCCVMPCVAEAAPVMVYEPYQMPQVYIVDRGPVYSGPGIYVNPTVALPRPMPHYPYVARDYPYVGHGHPGYLPPYVEPLRARAQVVSPRRAVRRAYK